MKIIEITISTSKKYNIGNYESLEFFACLKAELDHNDYDKVMSGADGLYQMCEKMITEANEKSGLRK